MPIRLSVVIPGYNTPENWWRRCIDSVLRAVGPDDEIICVDDGSSPELRCRLDTDDERIRVISLSKNGGLSGARNAGLEVSSGDYVTFVDSDDEVLPEAFAKSREAIARCDADIAVYGVKVIWTDEGLQKTDTFEKFEYVERMLPEHVRLLAKKRLFNYSCNKVYRRAFLEEHHLKFDREGMPSEDFIFNLSCLSAGASYCFVPFAGYVYYRRQGTLVSRYNKSLHRGIMLQSEVSRAFRLEHPEFKGVFDNWGELTPLLLDGEDWRNAWLPGTPYPLSARWKMKPGMPFFKMLIFMLVRKYLYIRPLRRRNLRRNFPNVVDWHEA